jgi:hypothetical protein
MSAAIIGPTGVAVSDDTSRNAGLLEKRLGTVGLRSSSTKSSETYSEISVAVITGTTGTGTGVGRAGGHTTGTIGGGHEVGGNGEGSGCTTT